MSNNFYEILELTKDCSQEDISSAFRRLSIKNHPGSDDKSKDYANRKYFFNRITEAYEVLSDPSKRALYDVYGIDALRGGIIDKDKNLVGGYKYGGNGEKIFENFFGTMNHYELIKYGEIMENQNGSMFSSSFGGLYAKAEAQEENLVVELECTLEELYNGCIKKLSYERRVLNSDGRITSEKNEERDIEIFKGYDKTTVLRFPGYGHEVPGRKTPDLIVKIKEKKHPKFKRANTKDLIYTHKINLVEALNSVPVPVITLDKRKLTITMDEIISPQTVKLVKGEGMPIFDKEKPLDNLLFKERKGDMYIKFDIKFPSFIDPIKKEEITRLLEENDE